MERETSNKKEPKIQGPIIHQQSNPSSCAVSETTSLASPTSAHSPILQSPSITEKEKEKEKEHQQQQQQTTTTTTEAPTTAATTTTKPSSSTTTTTTACTFPPIVIRDFAYSPSQPLFHGPPAHDPMNPDKHQETQDSDISSDATTASGGGTGGGGSSRPSPDWNPDAMYDNTLPSTSFGDGPPYSEDEDLHSPILITTRRRRSKGSIMLDGRASGFSDGVNGGGGGASGSGGGGGGGGNGSNNGNGELDNEKGIFVSDNGDGTETYYMPDEDAVDDGPGGEYVTYDDWQEDDSRLSRDFHFAITSPDEEMHGKAIALFDFQSMHENELPLREGQVILVSYRHGEGWLVAEDPKTGESGLVPEAYVRLARHIEGGLNSLNGEQGVEGGGTAGGGESQKLGEASGSAAEEEQEKESTHGHGKQKEEGGCIKQEEKENLDPGDNDVSVTKSGDGGKAQGKKKPLSIDCTKQVQQGANGSSK